MSLLIEICNHASGFAGRCKCRRWEYSNDHNENTFNRVWNTLRTWTMFSGALSFTSQSSVCMESMVWSKKMTTAEQFELIVAIFWYITIIWTKIGTEVKQKKFKKYRDILIHLYITATYNYKFFLDWQLSLNICIKFCRLQLCEISRSTLHTEGQAVKAKQSDKYI